MHSIQLEEYSQQERSSTRLVDEEENKEEEEYDMDLQFVELVSQLVQLELKPVWI
jgi:hypothetical protein